MATNPEFEYGVIEGFFGKPWGWQMREDYASFLKQNGFRFYIYAPKADPYLRTHWQDFWPDATFAALQKLGEQYQQAGLAWGLGINLYNIHFDYDRQTIEQLETKIQYLNQLQPNILAILFDDMRGDCDRIASIQTEITHRITELSTAQRFMMCPTYYSGSNVLDRLFGERPSNYLETLGQQLDPQVQVFWTGPEICSSHYPLPHLQEVSQKLGRKPFIWDNYPVNDSANTCDYLHLRAFENRPYQMQEWTSGHVVNPMNQAYLSQIPLQTLHLSYQDQDRYCPQQALQVAATALCGKNVAKVLLADLPLFQDQGLKQLSPTTKTELIAKYAKIGTKYTQEIVSWLQGEFPFSTDCLTE